METENIQGSCHCQTVNFEVQVDLEKTGTYKCNCSYCGKARNWGVMIKPNQFRWTKGESSAFDGISPERLANLRVQLMNGHDNDWFNTPKVFSHL